MTPVFCVALALLLGMASPPATEERVALTPEMLLNETAIGDASRLIDEPATVATARPERAFFPGWGTWQYPTSVVVDLGQARRVTRVLLYNESGEHTLALSTGKPFAWTPQSIRLDGYRAWKTFAVDATTRYLRLTLFGPTALSELAIFAEPAPLLKRAEKPRSRPARQRPAMETFIGTNAFIDDPVETLAASVGFVREYHNWAWDTEGPDGRVRFQPSGAAGGNAWFFDDYYARLKALAVTVAPALQQNSPIHFPGPNREAKPVPPGADPEAPASYALHAAHLFQFAARYGSRTVADDQIALAPGQPRRSGLNTLRYLENWNEPDKTWEGRAGRFHPFELAAMCSADRDGDQGRLGPGHGIKAADPSLQLVMGGLAAGFHLDYLRAMQFWADHHRNGAFPADVLNLHFYASDGTDEQAFKTTGLSPEAYGLEAKLRPIVAWRDSVAPQCALWVTEFGYDTHPKSPLHAPAIGSFDAEQVQAIWLVRTYLLLAASGVDRAAMFLFRDVKSDDPGVFATCGMVTEKGQWKPKPSYAFIATLKHRLTGLRYAADVASGSPDVRIQRYTGAGGRTVYALWATTSDDRTVSGIRLRLKSERATRIDFVAGTLTGKPSPLSVTRGFATLSVREQPVLIIDGPAGP
jgi:hypothetical protein